MGRKLLEREKKLRKIVAVILAASGMVLALPMMSQVASAHHLQDATPGCNQVVAHFAGFTAADDPFGVTVTVTTDNDYSTNTVTGPDGASGSFDIVVPYNTPFTTAGSHLINVTASWLTGNNGENGENFTFEADCVPQISGNVSINTGNCSDGHTLITANNTSDQQTEYYTVSINGDVVDSGNLQAGESYSASFLTHKGATSKFHVVLSYGEGKTVDEASAIFTRTCISPRARFIGPCGDPFYKAAFNNRHSTVPVTFRFIYTAYNGGKTVIVRTVAAGVRVTTANVHVLGGSKMTLRAAGHLLHTKNAAPAGNYGTC